MAEGNQSRVQRGGWMSTAFHCAEQCHRDLRGFAASAVCLGQLDQERSAWIAGWIQRVPEARQLLTAGQPRLHGSRSACWPLDAREQRFDSVAHAAMGAAA